MKMKTNLRNASLLSAVMAVAPLTLLAQDNWEPDFEAETTDLDFKTFQVTADYFQVVTDNDAPVGAGLLNTITDERDSDLYGGTLSYGFTSQLFVDLSYWSGDGGFIYRSDPDGLPSLYALSDVQRDEDWLELRFRYTPEWGLARAVQVYIAGGLSYLQSDYDTYTTLYTSSNNQPVAGNENIRAAYGDTANLFANIGLGVGSIKDFGAVSLGFKAEATVLAGQFDRNDTVFDGTNAISSGDDQTIWGAVLRGSGFVLIPLDQAGRNGLMIEAGLRFYHWELDPESQSVWGPFLKAGYAVKF